MKHGKAVILEERSYVHVVVKHGKAVILEEFAICTIWQFAIKKILKKTLKDGMGPDQNS